MRRQPASLERELLTVGKAYSLKYVFFHSPITERSVAQIHPQSKSFRSVRSHRPLYRTLPNPPQDRMEPQLIETTSLERAMRAGPLARQGSVLWVNPGCIGSEETEKGRGLLLPGETR